MWTGIDIGHSNIKVVQIIRSWNKYRLVGIAKLKNTLPPDNSADGKAARFFIRYQLQRIFAANNLSLAKCIVGVTGKDINLRVIQMPPIKSPTRFRKMIGYELMQLSGKSGDNLYSDYCRLHLPNKSYPEVPVMVGMAKGSFIDEEISKYTKIGLQVNDISPNAIALSYALRENKIVQPEETVLLADFGAINTEIVIHQGKNLIFARNISMGGENLTESIQTRLKVTRDEAESLKVTNGKITPRETELSGEERLLQEALRSGAGQFESSIESAIAFALTQLKAENISPDRILISGGSARLPGLAGYLSDSVGKPVEVFEPFGNINLSGVARDSREKIAEFASDFSVALGLALTGAVTDRGAMLSFLPPAQKKKKAFYQTAFPLFAASVLIIMGIMVWLASNYFTLQRETARLHQLQAEQDKFMATRHKLDDIQDRQKGVDNSSRRLNEITESTDFLYFTTKLAAQYLPPEVWISQLALNYIPPSRDARPVQPADKNKLANSEIIISGYLEDDNTYNLEQFKKFVDELNQPNDYMPCEATLKKLDTPKTVTPKGKKEFEISVRIRS